MSKKYIAELTDDEGSTFREVVKKLKGACQKVGPPKISKDHDSLEIGRTEPGLNSVSAR